MNVTILSTDVCLLLLAVYSIYQLFTNIPEKFRHEENIPYNLLKT